MPPCNCNDLTSAIPSGWHINFSKTPFSNDPSCDCHGCYQIQFNSFSIPAFGSTCSNFYFDKITLDFDNLPDCFKDKYTLFRRKPDDQLNDNIKWNDKGNFNSIGTFDATNSTHLVINTANSPLVFSQDQPLMICPEPDSNPDCTEHLQFNIKWTFTLSQPPPKYDCIINVPTHIWPLGIDDEEQIITGIRVYPNPSITNIFHLDLSEFSEGKLISIKVLTEAGNIIKNISTNELSKDYKLIIEGISSGNYLLIISDGYKSHLNQIKIIN